MTDSYYAAHLYYEIPAFMLGGFFYNLFVNELANKEDREKFSSSVFWGTFLLLCFGAILIIMSIIPIIKLTLPGITQMQFPHYRLLIFMEIIGGLLLSIYLIKKMIINGISDFKGMSLYVCLYPIITFIILLILCFILNSSVILISISTIISLLILINLFSKKLVKYFSIKNFDFSIFWKFLKRLVPFIFLIISSKISSFYALRLASESGEKIITLLNWGYKIIDIPTVAFFVIAGHILLPSMKNTFNTTFDYSEKTSLILSRSFMFTLLITFLYAVFLYTFSIFFKENQNISSIIRISYFFLPAIIGRGFYHIISQFYYFFGFEKQLAGFSILEAVLTILINFVFFPKFGYIVIALTSGTAPLVTSLLLYVYLLRKS